MKGQQPRGKTTGHSAEEKAEPNSNTTNAHAHLLRDMPSCTNGKVMSVLFSAYEDRSDVIIVAGACDSIYRIVGIWVSAIRTVV